MNNNIISLVKIPDSIVSKIYLKLFREKNSLMIFLFHGLFKDEKESSSNVVDPQYWITVKQFQQFIEYYLNHDYKFVSPEDLLNNLTVDKKYIMITFDDGYFSNQYALPVLKKYNIPAIFFISTDHVKYNKCFWWDVLFREMKNLNKSKKEIIKEQKLLKTKKNQEIEAYLKNKFGEKAIIPECDIDRPFNQTELKEFSKEKYVFLGNHTSDHSILINYPKDLIKSQILEAQNRLYEITGITPSIISYPDGAVSDEIIEISKEIGLKLGITTEFKKNYLPLDCKNNNCMKLGRYVLSGSDDILKQCELFRSDILLYTRLWNSLSKR